MTTVLLALDETDASTAAAVVAQKLFGAEATYLSLNVANSPEETSGLIWGGVYAMPYVPDGLWDDLAQASTDALAEAESTAAKRAESLGLEAEAIGEIGDPAHMIIDAAQEHGADVIVVGHHQRSWFQKLLDPSVTSELIANSQTPILVVPEPND